MAILRAEGLWDDPRAWMDFGGFENNFATIGNQQAHPEAALVEKLVNSIDAVLTLECALRGIEPEGPNAPTSIRSAVSTFFGIRDGNLANLTAKELSELAGRILLVATGSRQLPNLTVIDSGEGQAPTAFPTTFLSLNLSNKMKIPFVQGKFNMGGTGVLQFCGSRNFQLIVSRRHPSLPPHNPNWGFTFIRREDPAGGRRNSVYRYLLSGGRVPAFPHPQSGLPIQLDLPPRGTSDDINLTYGTLIKLYAYQLPGGAKTNILFDLFNHVNCLMPGVALPIRFIERRNYSGHTFESTMIGLEIRLDRDTADNLEFQPTFHTLLPDSLRLPAAVYAFKRKSEGGSASETFRGREGVIFVVNGQAHGYLDKSFFRRRKLSRISYASDDILMLIDASNLDGRTREDLFMNSRDRLRDGQLRREIEVAIEDCLSGHDLLIGLNYQRRERAIGKRLEEDQALEDILKDIILSSPVLAALLVTGARIEDPTTTKPGIPSKLDFHGQRFPKFFRLAKGNEQRTAHLGQRFKVRFETDAENSYFTRTQEPGELRLWVEGNEDHDHVINLMNGVGTLNVRLPQGAAQGSTLRWHGEVSDPSRVDPFEFSFERTVAAPIDPTAGPRGKRRPPAEEGEGERELPIRRALPRITSVRKAGWAEHEFGPDSSLRVKPSEDGHDFYVNLDNKFLAKELRSNPGNRSALEAQFKYGMALFGLAALRYLSQGDQHELETEEFIAELSKAFAPFLLPMIKGLSAIAADVREAENEESPQDEAD